MKFVKAFEAMVSFCVVFSTKLKEPNMPELYADMQALTSCIDPLKAMLGFALLGPDAQERVQQDAMRTVAAAAQSGLQQLAKIVGVGGDTDGLIKQYATNFLAIFDEAAELGLRLHSTKSH